MSLHADPDNRFGVACDVAERLMDGSRGHTRASLNYLLSLRDPDNRPATGVKW